MFGFGFGKLVGRVDEVRKRKVDEERKKSPQSIGEMEKCRVCGTYVVAGSAVNCGRKGCPY